MPPADAVRPPLPLESAVPRPVAAADGATISSALGAQLVTLVRAHRAAVAAVLGDLGLHVGQEFLLQLLWEHDGRSQAELSRAMGVEAPTVTKAVQRMERAGLVERHIDPVDGRISRVWLSPRGRGLREEVERRWLAVEHRMLEGIEPAEVAAVRAVLARMLHNLTCERPHPKPVSA